MHAFDVLGDPVRRRILKLLETSELSAGAITETIRHERGIPQPAVTRAAPVLRDHGFVLVRRDGERWLYSLRHEGLRDADEWLERFRRLWTPPLDALATEVARGKRQRRNRT